MAPGRKLFSYIGDNVVEYLEDHSQDTGILGSIFLGDTTDVLLNRLESLYRLYMGDKLEDRIVELVPLCVFLSQTLHDIGKAGDIYQKSLSEKNRDDATGKIAATFSGHEIFSSVILYKVFERLTRSSLIAALFALSVLQHHHAMRTIRELLFDRTVTLLRKGKQVWRLYCEPEHIVKIVESSLRSVQEVIREKRVVISDRIIDIRLGEVYEKQGVPEIMRNVLLEEKDGLRVKRCVSIIEERISRFAVPLSRALPIVTSMIVIPDRVSAQIRRGGSPTRLEVEFLRLIRQVRKYSQYIGRFPRHIQDGLKVLCEKARL